MTELSHTRSELLHIFFQDGILACLVTPVNTECSDRCTSCWGDVGAGDAEAGVIYISFIVSVQYIGY